MRGRPREFDEAEVLERAVGVFWRRGYEQTSLADLLEETGLARTSLYRTFGDKRQLYLRALRHYGAEATRLVQECIRSAGSPARGLARLLDHWDEARGRKGFAGCLVFNSIAELGASEDEGLRAAVLEQLGALRQCFLKALEEARAAGELPPETDPSHAAAALIAAGQAHFTFGRFHEDPHAAAVAHAAVETAKAHLGQA